MVKFSLIWFFTFFLHMKGALNNFKVFMVFASVPLKEILYQLQRISSSLAMFQWLFAQTTVQKLKTNLSTDTLTCIRVTLVSDEVLCGFSMRMAQFLVKKSFLCYRDQHLHRIRAQGSIRIRCGFSDKSLELYGLSGRHNSLSSQSIDIFHRSFMGWSSFNKIGHIFLSRARLKWKWSQQPITTK